MLGLAGPAGAEEYRLQVASLYRDSFVHYFDGPLGAGSGELAMDRLERDLGADRVSRGAMLGDRPGYGWDAVAASFRGGKVVAEIRAAEDSRRCDEVVWQGAPGERSVWVIGPTTTRTQEVDQIALLGMPKTRDPCSGAATSRAPPASAGGSRRWSGRT